MTNRSDGSTASYYQLPQGCTELQDLISYRNLNAQDGEIFRAIYRKGRASHSDELRDARKVLFYAQAEVKRLERVLADTADFDEPGAAMADDSPRMAAIGQNGNDGAIYSTLDRLQAAADFNDDLPAASHYPPQREPQQLRHRCLVCALGHATHECGAGR
jgi:hypothetical protein